MTSGRDWTDRTKRIAERAPGLDIFSQGFVAREPTGWRITPAGRDFLAAVEKPSAALVAPEAAALAAAVEPVPIFVDPPVVVLPVPLIGVNTRRQRKRRGSTSAPRCAVA